MPTTPEQFLALVGVCRLLVERQNNLRDSVQIIQASFKGTAPTLLRGDLAATQKAFADAGLAALQILAMKQKTDPVGVAAAATAVGIDPASLTDLETLVMTWATNLTAVSLKTPADVDTAAADLLAAVPAAKLPF